jgi:hypothetical protein
LDLKKVKRFNTILAGLTLTGGVIAMVMGMGACKKKDRLAQDTYAFRISPPAKKMLITDVSTFTLVAASASGSIATDPTWIVNPGNTTAPLNTSVGNVVLFTPPSFGDFTITATFDGRTASAQVDVVPFIIATTAFSVYTDAGLPPVSVGADSDVFTASGLNLTELTATSYTPEGEKFFRTTNAPDDFFWGITVDDDLSGNNQNLSAFGGGTLKFSIRLLRAMTAPETLRVDIVDGSSVTDSVLSSAWTGFDKTTVDEWQQVSIPISSFLSTNKSQIRVPFSIVGPALASSLSFDIDAVRWEP